MGALIDRFATAGVTLTALPDGRLHAAGTLTDELRVTIRTHKPAILEELAAANDAEVSRQTVPAPVKTPADADELRALHALVTVSWPEAERAESLAAALADPEAALASFRALAADTGTSTRAGARDVGPYTTATLAERNPTDNRRTCMDCANLTARECRCIAAWRGERPGNAARNYHPVPVLLKRCECYKPMPGEEDQRTGAERWPEMVADTRRMKERERHG